MRSLGLLKEACSCRASLRTFGILKTSSHFLLLLLLFQLHGLLKIKAGVFLSGVPTALNLHNVLLVQRSKTLRRVIPELMRCITLHYVTVNNGNFSFLSEK